MGGPIERTETAGLNIGGEVSATVGGKAGIPLIAEAKTDVKGTVSADGSTATTKKYSTIGLDAIVREIGDSDYVVFVDDFHYIERDVREEIGKQIKAAAEKGIRICTASVPHRSDDVVRSNPELRGRVRAIDMSYWTPQELEQIAFRGFRELNVDLAPTIIQALTNEAFGSPQLMQAICLNFALKSGSTKRRRSTSASKYRVTSSGRFLNEPPPPLTIQRCSACSTPAPSRGAFSASSSILLMERAATSIAAFSWR
jgi:hypothetical protein